METRQNAEELHKYLDFADIDWHNMKDTDFEKAIERVTLVKVRKDQFLLFIL